MIDTILVNSEEYETRFAACRVCEHFTAVGSCGTLGRKTRISTGRKGKKAKAELCGCFMKVKSRLKFAKCPIDRWGTAEATAEEMAFLKNAAKFSKSIDGKDTLTTEEVKKLYSYHNHTHGSKTKSSGCAPCVRTAIEELNKWVKDMA